MEVKIEKNSSAKILEYVIKRLESKVVKVGWIDYEKHNTSYSKEKSPYVAEIAYYNEMGNPSKNVPARPFLKPTIINKENEWKNKLFILSSNLLKNVISLDGVLDILGSTVVSDIQDTIRNLYSPALAESTILSRIRRNSKLSKIKGKINEKTLGSITKPLMDTRQMYDTLTYKVEEE